MYTNFSQSIFVNPKYLEKKKKTKKKKQLKVAGKFS